MVLESKIKLNPDEKIFIGDSYIYIEGNIMHVITVGDSDAASATQMKNISLALTEAYGPMNVFADINQAGKSSPEARKIWKELSEVSSFKLALVGLHPVARVIASFAMAFSKNQTTKFFTSKDEALAWLKA